MWGLFLFYEHEYEITQGIVIIKGVMINVIVLANVERSFYVSSIIIFLGKNIKQLPFHVIIITQKGSFVNS